MAKQKNSNGKANTYNDGLVNIIAKGTKIVGNVEIENDFRLDGEIEGDIVGRSKIIIGEKGVLLGSLQCPTAEVVGKISGNVTVEKLSIRSTASITGDVKTKFLTIEPGAVFNGSCSMSENRVETE